MIDDFGNFFSMDFAGNKIFYSFLGFSKGHLQFFSSKFHFSFERASAAFSCNQNSTIDIVKSDLHPAGFEPVPIPDATKSFFLFRPMP
jgi:hypothetical protein